MTLVMTDCKGFQDTDSIHTSTLFCYCWFSVQDIHVETQFRIHNVRISDTLLLLGFGRNERIHALRVGLGVDKLPDLQDLWQRPVIF